MNNEALLVTAMAEECKSLLLQSDRLVVDVPPALRPRHLLWMCEMIGERAETCPAEKLHRWLGFIQAGLIANRILDIAGVKAMFDKVKVAYGSHGDDLIDHLDPTSAFEIDLGGEA